MTERLSLRRRLKASNNRRNRPTHPSPSTSRGNSSSRRSSKNKSTKPVKSLTRCASAPAVFGTVEESVNGEDRASLECDDGVLTRGKTCWDGLSTSAPSYLSRSLRIHEENYSYDKDAKVVVNVMVEGSAGSIRAMVRLGSNVEDMIKLVMEIYGKEGRRPKLDHNNLHSFELHDSYFSLHCLGKSDLIGDVGSRSFYLRASKTSTQPETSSASFLIKTEQGATRSATDPTLQTAFLFLPGFISRRVSKFIRRTRKLWKLLGCMQSA